MKYLWLLLVLSFTVFSDEVVSRADGSKVVLKDDGTWVVQKSENLSIVSESMSTACDVLVCDSVDGVTGDRIISGKSPIIVSSDNKSGIVLIFFKRANNKSMILAIKAVGASSCIDAESKINILYEDGTRHELITDGKFNCEGSATVYFGGIFGKEQSLDKLCTKRIKTMRVWTMKSYVQEDFSHEIATKVMHTFRCIRDF